MEAARVSGSKRVQLRITDFFHTLHVLLIEPESYCPFYQSLITDYFREVDFAIADSESYFDERRIVPSFSKSVSQAFVYTLLERPIPSSEPQTLVSMFDLSNSSFTHVSETPGIWLRREMAEAVGRLNNIAREGPSVQRILW